MWCPPTPPQELDDVYIDANLHMLYQQVPIPDSELPPVFVKKDLKRSRTAEITNNLDIRRNKISRREDSPISAPRSLFDHPSLPKIRRDVKMQKYRSITRPLVVGDRNIPLRIPQPRDENAPEWTVHEDWALLQAVDQLQELPLNLMVMKTGHLPNWELVADMVNMVSCTTRSAAQCRNRYEGVIIPREEGNLIQEQKKKTKSLYKLPLQKTSRVLRTHQLNAADNNAGFTEAYHQRFDNIKNLVMSRKPNPKPLLVNPSLKNPKHFAVLTECGVVYDSPLNPIEIAARRADRIARDKKMQVQAAVQAVQASQSSSPTQGALTPEQATAQRQLAAASAASKAAQTPQVQVPPATPVSSSVNAAVSIPSAIVGTAQIMGSIGSVSPVATSATSTTTQSTVVASGASVNPTQIQPVNALRQTRPVTTIPVGLQEMVVAAGQTRISTAGSTPTVVSVSGLTPAQLQAARLTSGSLVTIPTSVVKGATAVQMGAARTVSPAQMNFFKQQPLLRPQQRIGVREQPQVKVVQSQAAKVASVGQVQPVVSAQSKAQYLKAASAPTTRDRTKGVADLVMQQFPRQQKVQSSQQQAITAQFLSQVQAGSAQVATLVKTSTGQNVTIPLPTLAVSQVKGPLTPQLKTPTVAGQSMRLGLANYTQLLTKQTRQGKVTQVGKQGVPTQLIVQSQQGTKVPTINMQHIHQVIKTPQAQHITVAAGQGITSGGQVVLAKAGTSSGGTIGPRVLPAVAGTRQTIQVVPGPIRSVSGVAQVSSATLAGSLKVAGTSQQAFISQVTGLPSIVRQASANPVRIQSSTSGSPIVAVSVQQQQQLNQQLSDQGQS